MAITKSREQRAAISEGMDRYWSDLYEEAFGRYFSEGLDKTVRDIKVILVGIRVKRVSGEALTKEERGLLRAIDALLQFPVEE